MIVKTPGAWIVLDSLMGETVTGKQNGTRNSCLKKISGGVNNFTTVERVFNEILIL